MARIKGIFKIDGIITNPVAVGDWVNLEQNTVVRKAV
jgi:hypothetical protein